MIASQFLKQPENIILDKSRPASQGKSKQDCDLEFFLFRVADARVRRWKSVKQSWPTCWAWQSRSQNLNRTTASAKWCTGNILTLCTNNQFWATLHSKFMAYAWNWLLDADLPCDLKMCIIFLIFFIKMSFALNVHYLHLPMASTFQNKSIILWWAIQVARTGRFFHWKEQKQRKKIKSKKCSQLFKLCLLI